MLDTREQLTRLTRQTLDFGRQSLDELGAARRGARRLDPRRKRLLWGENVFLLAVLAGAGYALGAFTRMFAGFLALQLLSFWAFTRFYYGLAREKSKQAGERMALLWDLGLFAVTATVALALVERVEMTPTSAAILVLVVLPVLGFLFVSLWSGAARATRIRIPIRRLRPQRIPIRRLRPPEIHVVLIAVPLLFSWAVMSTVWWIVRPHVGPVTAETRRLLEREKDGRLGRSVPPVPIAVTLSGGGYRAAAFHAGVLRALDRAGVWIDYLSTNSGGSIVGAYYALGHAPDAFLERIKAGPRLPNDYFALGALVGQLVVPGYTDGDTYANHFDRILFGSRDLDEDCWPTLLINVTDYASGQPRVYRCPADPLRRTPTGLPVARAVAASGALPGIAGSVPIHGRHYMDGAARDNLGYIGLETYFAATGTDAAPSLVLISNATLPLAPKPGPAKVWLGEALLRGYVALLDETRSRLLRQVMARRFVAGPGAPGPTAGRPASPRATAGLEQAHAVVLSLDDVGGPGAAGYDRCGSPEAVRAAPHLDTLHELTPGQVELLACLGDTMTTARLERLDCYLEALSGGRDPRGCDRP